MSNTDINKLKYTIALISEFASSHNLRQKQAYNYLKHFKGLDFLSEHYDYMHTQSFEDAVESMLIVCKRNGGSLA